MGLKDFSGFMVYLLHTLPGTPDLDRGPGGSPKTSSDPESTFSLPTMHFSKVVFPQPDGPKK